MGEHEFTLLLDVEPAYVQDEVVLDKLYEMGCDDATFGVANGVPYAEFIREGPPHFPNAVVNAIRQVEAVPGIMVRRVEPDELVTMSEIADRLGESRESIRLKIAGARGRGDFPRPVTPFRPRSRLWRWSEVAAWAGVWGEEERARARFIEAVNAALEHRHRGTFSDEDRHLVETVAEAVAG